MNYNNKLYSGSGSVISYDQADKLLQGRNKTSKKLANNTYLLRGDGVFTVRLHATDVVTIHQDGTYTLNSGGWQTVTTKDRLNKYAPAWISQRSGVWYLGDGSLFTDGVNVDSDGNPTSAGIDPANYEAELKAIKKQARKYARDFAIALQVGKVRMPSAGDCWFCAMRTESGQALGDATSNNDHLRDHMAESYFVPSLLVNAGRDAGYQDMQIGLMGLGGHRVFIDPENNIYKYLVKKLKQDIK